MDYRTPMSSAPLGSSLEGLQGRENTSCLGEMFFLTALTQKKTQCITSQSAATTCPLWWRAFFPHQFLFHPPYDGIISSAIYLSSSQAGQESLLPPNDWFFFIRFSGFCCAANKGGSQRNMVLFNESHFKPFIWILNYPQHWTLLRFADGKQHLPNSLYHLGCPQLTLKLFWCSSDHFCLTMSLRLSQAPTFPRQVAIAILEALWAGIIQASLLSDLPGFLNLPGHETWGCAVLLQDLTCRTQLVLLIPCRSLWEAYVSVEGTS